MSLILSRRTGESILFCDREDRAVIRVRFLDKQKGEIQLAIEGGLDEGLAAVREEIHSGENPFKKNEGTKKE